MSPYSAFFSSGLLAPYHDSDIRPITPPPPAPPPSSPTDSTFPIATASNGTATNPPRLRRRRSSLTVAQSPMTGIKSPQRNARQALMMSPSRSGLRACASGNASEGNSLMGRIAMRSASLNLGLGLKPRRLLRRIPTAPPPTSPLPAVPASPKGMHFPSPVTPRPALSLLPSDPNFLEVESPSDLSFTDPVLNAPMAMDSDVNFGIGFPVDEEMKEN